MKSTTFGCGTDRAGACAPGTGGTTGRSGDAGRRRLPRDTIRICARVPIGHRAGLRLLALAGCLALVAGCATTAVDRVWRDSARGEAALGKTLVLALIPDARVAVGVEEEWTRQLRGHGIEAVAVAALLPGTRPPDKQHVVELVKAGGFTTLLVTRLVAVKRVERDVAASQVAVVETHLYDTGTEQPFWSARSDTYLVSPTGDARLREPRHDQIRGFVAAMIRTMGESKVL